jgi:hypothetical protein
MRSSLPIGNASAPPPKVDWFGRLAVVTARLTGRPATFLLAIAVVIVWAVKGPLFGFSDTWPLKRLCQKGGQEGW